MAPGFTFVSLLAIATASFAAPVVIDEPFIRLPLTKQHANGTFNILEYDRARLQQFKQNGGLSNRAITSTGIQNQAANYVAVLGVGSPMTEYNLLVDSGSSNTWLGHRQPYVVTSTSEATGNNVAVTYGSGSFSGTEYTDTVTLGAGLTIAGQSIGVASASSGFASDLDGILGIGPTDLTANTLSGTSATIPTVVDNLFSQGKITNDLVAISFEPTNYQSVVNGELTFGGTDSSKYTGTIAYCEIAITSPANKFWGIEQSITMGPDGVAQTPILSMTAGILDTGTTLLLLATDAFDRYKAATGATLDPNTGLLKVLNMNQVQPMNFNICGTTFQLTANAQIWPRNLNPLIGGTPNSIYLIVNDLGSPSGEGLDFINGQAFLERFYTVLDTKNHRIGIANTPFTKATTN